MYSKRGPRSKAHLVKAVQPLTHVSLNKYMHMMSSTSRRVGSQDGRERLGCTCRPEAATVARGEEPWQVTQGCCITSCRLSLSSGSFIRICITTTYQLSEHECRCGLCVSMGTPVEACKSAWTCSHFLILVECRILLRRLMQCMASCMLLVPQNRGLLLACIAD